MTKLPIKYPFILIIDENEIDCIINQHIISVSGIAKEVRYITTARKGLEYLQIIDNKTATTPLPDLILLKHQMSQMDGFQFLENFEKLSPGIKAHCKIVMYAAYISPQLIHEAILHPRIKQVIKPPISYYKLKYLNV